MKTLLMIDPDFPSTRKSVNHADIIPIGLLKIGAYYQHEGWDVHLLRLCESDTPIQCNPDKIIVTSLFTYWSEQVIEAVKYARDNYPNTYVEVGGIWASLMPEKCKELTGADNVYCGIHKAAEEFEPDYSLLSSEIDYQIIHTSRGCNRRCKTCGVYCIEPHLEFRDSIKELIHKKKIVLYDNNFLLNPHVENILRELIVLKRKRLIKSVECQSGFDGRILRKNPQLGKMIKEAGFVFPKIAWDGKYKTWKKREEEINILKDAGYISKHIGVFFLENHDLPYAELEKKRLKCWEWRVQVINCRYRPLNQLYDNYNGRLNDQSSDEFYLHPNWTFKEIKTFNRSVKLHNTCVRFYSEYYSRDIAYKKLSKERIMELRYLSYDEAKDQLDDCWNPAEFHEVL